MAKLFPVIVKKTTEAVIAGTNFVVFTMPALAVSTVNSIIAAKPAVNVGLALDHTRQRVVTAVNAALALSTVNTFTPALVQVNPALATSVKADLAPSSVPQTPAAEVKQIQFDLTHRRGGSSQVNTGSAWTNPANVISGTDGKNDGLTATRASSATQAIDGTLTLSYPAQTSRTALVISSVKLFFYVAQSGTTLNNGGLTLSYNLGGADTTLQVFTGNQSSLTTPLEYDITAAVGGDWTKVAALQTKIRFNTALGVVGVTGTADAVEVEVIASETLLT